MLGWHLVPIGRESLKGGALSDGHLGMTVVTLGERLGTAWDLGLLIPSAHWQQTTVHGTNSSMLLTGSGHVIH